MAIIAIVAVLAAVAPSFLNSASAKISPPSCTTSSGQTPPGQQPVCNGGGLEQKPAKNPAGHEPPGQQP